MARLLCVLLLAFSAGCRTIDAPDGWVTLDSSGDAEVEAVASAGHRLVVRRHPNPDGGTVQFWSDAVRRELVDGRGYRLLEATDVTSRDGWLGREMVLEADVALRPYTYLVAVFIDPGGILTLWSSRVVVVEAAGESEVIREQLPAVRAAARSVR